MSKDTRVKGHSCQRILVSKDTRVIGHSCQRILVSRDTRVKGYSCQGTLVSKNVRVNEQGGKCSLGHRWKVTRKSKRKFLSLADS